MQWQIDPTHTSITAAVKHMMLTTVRGGFGGATGVIDFDPASPEAGGIELRIPAKTVNTGDEKRDGHLRSADFLDADNHPEIVFKSTKVTPKSKGEFVVDGDLTIQGTLNFVGLVLTRGRTNVRNALSLAGVIGNGTICGSLWTQGVNLDVGSSLLVGYSTQALALANQVGGGGALPAPLRVTTLADCAVLPAATGGCP